MAGSEAKSLSEERSRVEVWLFPVVLALGLVSLAVVIAVGHVRQRRAATAPRVRTLPPSTAPGSGWIHFVEVLAAVVLFIALAKPLGFLVLGSIVLLYLCRRLGGSWLQSVVATLILVPATYALFSVVLRVPLPRGLIPW